MRAVTLTVTFDIDQDSQLLQWSFSADGKPITGQGVETGLLAFKQEDQIKVVAIVNSQNKDLKQIEIQDCYMITTPRAFTARENKERAGEFAEPSPFSQNNAVVSLGSATCEGSSTQVVWQPDLTLECTNQGRWEMSFIMTTAISRISGNPKNPERRVFGFDPECEVGTGV